MYFLLKMLIFHCYVSLLEGNIFQMDWFNHQLASWPLWSRNFMLIDAEVLHRSCIDLHLSILKMDMVRCLFMGRCDNIFPNSYWKESSTSWPLCSMQQKLGFLDHISTMFGKNPEMVGAGRTSTICWDSQRKTSRKGHVKKIQHFQKHLPKRLMKGKNSKCKYCDCFLFQFCSFTFGGGTGGLDFVYMSWYQMCRNFGLS